MNIYQNVLIIDQLFINYFTSVFGQIGLLDFRPLDFNLRLDMFYHQEHVGVPGLFCRDLREHKVYIDV